MIFVNSHHQGFLLRAGIFARIERHGTPVYLPDTLVYHTVPLGCEKTKKTLLPGCNRLVEKKQWVFQKSSYKKCNHIFYCRLPLRHGTILKNATVFLLPGFENPWDRSQGSHPIWVVLGSGSSEAPNDEVENGVGETQDIFTSFVLRSNLKIPYWQVGWPFPVVIFDPGTYENPWRCVDLRLFPRYDTLEQNKRNIPPDSNHQELFMTRNSWIIWRGGV